MKLYTASLRHLSSNIELARSSWSLSAGGPKWRHILDWHSAAKHIHASKSLEFLESNFKTPLEIAKARALELLDEAYMEENEDGSDKEIPAVMRKFFVSNEEGIRLFATLKECYDTAYEEHLADRKLLADR
jgi:hypothetical protein